MSMAGRPTAFVSYSHRHDSEDWLPRVLLFNELLREASIDSMLDQYDPPHQRDWSIWGPAQIKRADWVLCLPTEAFYVRWQNLSGSGLADEARAIRERFRGTPDAVRFVLIEGCEARFIPDDYRGLDRVVVDDLSPEGIEHLVRLLTRQPKLVPRQLGQVPILDPYPSPLDVGNDRAYVYSTARRELDALRAKLQPIPTGAIQPTTAGLMFTVGLSTERVREFLPNDSAVRVYEAPVHAFGTRHYVYIERTEDVDAVLDIARLEKIEDSPAWSATNLGLLLEVNLTPEGVEQVSRVPSVTVSAQPLHMVDETGAEMLRRLNWDSRRPGDRSIERLTDVGGALQSYLDSCMTEAFSLPDIDVSRRNGRWTLTFISQTMTGRAPVPVGAPNVNVLTRIGEQLSQLLGGVKAATPPQVTIADDGVIVVWNWDAK